MIIDIHTHFYPKKIALKVLNNAKQKLDNLIYGNGTINSLKKYMLLDKIAISVNLPIATKSDQVISINRKMIDINRKNKNIICFGTLHPDFGTKYEIEDELKFLKKNKIKGIKLHPEYQCFSPDDKKMFFIYELCIKYDLIILFHSGYDFYFDYKNVHSNPKKFLKVHNSFSNLKMILAHMGGYHMWEEVLKVLVGKKIYFDTSFTHEMDNKMMKDIIFNHGPDKILFGSDFPWQRQSNILKKLKKIVDNKKYLDMILYQNTKELLDL